MPAAARSDFTFCARTPKDRPFEVMSLGNSSFSFGFEIPDACTSAFAFVRFLCTSDFGKAPRNIDGITPVARAAPEPATRTYP